MENLKIKKFIDEKYKNPKYLSSSRILSLLKNKEIFHQCEIDLKNNPMWINEKNVLKGYFYNLKSLGKCCICGNYVSPEKTFKAFNQNTLHKICCSKKCVGKFLHNHKNEIQNKVKQTNLEKYGVENPFQSEEIKNKIKQTNLEKYGVENPFQSEEIKNKIKQTNLEKYGVEFQQSLSTIKNKIKQTNLEKYGVEAPLQNKNILLKLQQTNLEKYGVNYTLQLDEVKEKSKQTCLKKYGVPHSAYCKNRINSILNKSWNTIINWNEYVIPMFSKEDWLGENKINEYKWKCAKCGNIFTQKIMHTFPNKLFKTKITGFSNIPRCPTCYPKHMQDSISENELLTFCQTFFKDATKTKLEIAPYELDVYIPDKKIAFEFNGTYWHNSDHKDPNYHLMKTKLCEEKRIKLIHIWEHDWANKNSLIKEKIKALLGVEQKKIYARKCIIKDVDNNTKNEFLNTNHIQGEDKSGIKLGLYYNNELVAIMTFGKPRFNKKYEYELIRYATKSGYRVVGGAGKLLKNFERNYNPKSIITYADRCYSQGNMYRKIGFNELTPSKPSYFWINDTIIYSRYQTQKSKLSKLLGDKFNKDLTENENMLRAGFYKIYDCGNLVFEKIYKII